MRTKRLLALSLAFFLVSLGILVLSFSSYKPASATGGSYSENWTILKCRAVNADIPGFGNKTIFLGPAVWQNVITIGGSTTTETWEGAGWADTKDFWNATNHASFQTVPQVAGSSVCGLATIVGDYAQGIATAGSYGYVFTNDPSYGRAGAGSSIPTAWSVTGTLL